MAWVVGRRYEALASSAALALVGVAAVFAAVLSLSGPGRPVDPALTGSRGLASLPLAAQGPVSGVLGRDDRSYLARRAGGGFTVVNRGQHLWARFGRQGVWIHSGRVALGLSLAGYGRGGTLLGVDAAVPRAQGNRVVYGRRAVSEWYVNGPLGLEQGFTVRARPAGGGPLTLAVAVTGNVRGLLSARGDAVGFRGAGGSLAYRGLVVTDARGRTVRARIEVRRAQLLLRVADGGARYPITIDPFFQQAKLTASDGGAGDALGFSAAMSGDTIVAGAPGATVNGNSFQGAAYVFVRPNGGWTNATQTAKLTASDGASNDVLGLSVAVSGDTIVAGAAGAAVNGNANQGAAYVFVKPKSGWVNATQTAKLTASDGRAADGLGISVGVSGETIVAGAVGAPPNNQGAVYVFVKPESGFVNATQTAKLTASDGGGALGFSVAVSGDTIAAGAVGANSGDGAAYVFVMPKGGWVNATQTAKLTASDGAPGAVLGFSVAVSGITIVAGAPGATVNGNSFQGAAYVFVRPAGGWANETQTAKLTASDGAANDSLGLSVATTGARVAAGAIGATVGGHSMQGAVYVFDKSGGGWVDKTETAKLTVADGAAGDQFGSAVAMSPSTIVGGALNVTVNGNARQGAAYVFQPRM